MVVNIDVQLISVSILIIICGYQSFSESSTQVEAISRISTPCTEPAGVS